MRNFRTFVLVAFTMALFSGMAVSQEKKIRRSELPAAVERTVAAESNGATIRGFSQETEHGQINYEVELLVNGHSKDIAMNAAGEIVEMEEQVALDTLPAAVRGGLQVKAGQGKLLKVESIVKRDKLVAYEAQILKDGKQSEVQVGPDGKPLDHDE